MTLKLGTAVYLVDNQGKLTIHSQLQPQLPPGSEGRPRRLRVPTHSENPLRPVSTSTAYDDPLLVSDPDRGSVVRSQGSRGPAFGKSWAPTRPPEPTVGHHHEEEPRGFVHSNTESSH